MTPTASLLGCFAYNLDWHSTAVVNDVKCWWIPCKIRSGSWTIIHDLSLVVVVVLGRQLPLRINKMGFSLSPSAIADAWFSSGMVTPAELGLMLESNCRNHTSSCFLFLHFSPLLKTRCQVTVFIFVEVSLCVNLSGRRGRCPWLRSRRRWSRGRLRRRRNDEKVVARNYLHVSFLM